KSSATAEDDTRSCESTVLMIADIMAAKISPATNGWNNTCAKTIKIVSSSASTCIPSSIITSITCAEKMDASAEATYAKQTKPVKIAQYKQRIIYVVPMNMATVKSFAVRIVIKGTIIIGSTIH